MTTSVAASSRPAGRRVAVWLGLLVVIASAALGACGGTAGVTVEDAWVRPQDNLENPSGGYMRIVNSGSTDDALVGASSPASERVEIHETMVVEPSAMPSDSMEPDSSMGTDGGMMGMVPVESVSVPAGSTVELKPGSFHLMFVGLRAPLEVGDKVDVTLSFREAGSVKVTAEVREP